jgi:anthranilate/para-aminobenzoate synthase component I
MPRGPFILELEDIGFDDAARALSEEPGFVCIDARGAHPAIARHSIIAANPVSTFSMAGGFITVDGHTTIDSPQGAIARFCAEVDRWLADPYIPFNCGVIGYIGFEAASALKGLAPAEGFSRHPQCRLGIYGAVILYDNLERTAIVVGSGDDRSKARRRAYILHDMVASSAGRVRPRPGSVESSGVRMTPGEAEFRRTVEMARSWIRSDIADRIHVVRHAEAPFTCTSPLAAFLAEGKFEGVRALVGHEGANFSFSSTDTLISVEGGALRSTINVGAGAEPAAKILRDEITTSFKSICEDGEAATRTDGGRIDLEGVLGCGLVPIDAVIGMMPSHAATGTPYGKALSFIGQSEELHRAFYGGAFGTMDALRCTFRTIERASTFTDGTVGTTAGIDMDENSDADEISRRLFDMLSRIT